MAASESYHEQLDKLTPETQDLHRALTSLQEELEAIDWYQQRVDATDDVDLKRILGHNRDEEKEHAAMVLEWIRRKDPKFDQILRTYLFTEGDVTLIEEEEGEAVLSGDATSGEHAATPSPTASFRLTIGSLMK